MTQYNNRSQYNNYQKKSYNNNSGNSSNGGQAKITSTKKSGCILEVNLNNQNLVLKGFWDNRINGWKLFPYYDKTKTNPQFNQPKPSNDMDDALPNSEKEWQQSPVNDTSFDPDQYEQELG